jgi:hypothetical protein
MRGRYENLLLVCDVADQFIEIAKGKLEEEGMRERIILTLLDIEDILDKGRAIPGPVDASEEIRLQVNTRMDHIRAEISELLQNADKKSLLDSVRIGGFNTSQWIERYAK